MTKRINTFVHKSSRRVLHLALLSSLSAAVPLLAAGGTATNGYEQAHAGHQAASAKLVQLVRDATRQFIDVGAATNAGYGQFLGCVSGPDHGAMGVHYVNGPLVADGEIDATARSVRSLPEHP